MSYAPPTPNPSVEDGEVIFPNPNSYKRKRKQTAKPDFFFTPNEIQATGEQQENIPPAFVGRVSAYCTTESYDSEGLCKFYLNKGLKPQHSNDTVLVEVKGSTGVVCFFDYGVVVMWGLTDREERSVLFETDTYRVSPNAEVEMDDLEYTYGDVCKVKNDRLTLDNHDPLTKQAISIGIAQSTKLSFYEDNVEHIKFETRNLPIELAKKGKISLSSSQLSKLLAKLFIEKSNVNLSSVVGTPDFIWEHQIYEKQYTMIRNYLEIQSRVKFLNQRLQVLHDLFEMLKGEVLSRSSQKQEWIVIALILIELFFLVFEVVIEYLIDFVIKK